MPGARLSVSHHFELLQQTESILVRLSRLILIASSLMQFAIIQCVRAETRTSVFPQACFSLCHIHRSSSGYITKSLPSHIFVTLAMRFLAVYEHPDFSDADLNFSVSHMFSGARGATAGVLSIIWVSAVAIYCNSKGLVSRPALYGSLLILKQLHRIECSPPVCEQASRSRHEFVSDLASNVEVTISYVISHADICAIMPTPSCPRPSSIRSDASDDSASSSYAAISVKHEYVLQLPVSVSVLYDTIE